MGYKSKDSFVCIVGCLIWVFSRYKTLKHFVKMWVSSSRYVVVRSWRMWSMFIILLVGFFGSPGSLLVILKPFMGL